MEQLFDSGLFMELGEVVGHDPVFYEDISKQHEFNTYSHVNGTEAQTEDQIAGMADPVVSLDLASGDSELESLLAEGNHLLEQLMAANGLELSLVDAVDLANIDELAENTLQPVSIQASFAETQDDFLSELKSLAEPEVYNDYPLACSPTSSISTLPSEPSSPIDLFSLQGNSVPQQQETDIAELFHSLIDNEAVPDDYGIGYHNESLISPTPSNDSYYSNYQSPESDESWTYSDNGSSVNSPQPSVLSDAPTKSKPKRKSKSTPYSQLPAGRKERKKQQNKEAAIRYREKKRLEAMEVNGEEAQLSEKNKELKTEVLNLEREIMCMKELLSDVFNIHSL